MYTMETDVTKSPSISKVVEKKHLNKWVAFSKDYKKVLAFGDKLVDVDRKIGDRKAVFTKILPDAFFAPSSFD